jgi:hypothetical protein
MTLMRMRMLKVTTTMKTKRRRKKKRMRRLMKATWMKRARLHARGSP